MRVLVTGGAGFVGSHLVELLLRGGHEVVVVDDFSSSRPRNLSHLAGSARLTVNRRDVRAPLTGRYDAIYHLASPASPEDYAKRPIDTLLTNALGTWRALELARRSEAPFLLASTSEVYGDPLEQPQRESYAGNVDPIGPRSAYDEGKRFAEALTVAYVRTHGVDARVARIFNSYGPRMRPEDGRMPSSFIASALRGDPIPVHGSGRQSRSLCYVRDTVRGLVAVMRRGRTGEAYNIGRPDELSVLEFARLVRKLTRSSSPIRFTRARPGDIQRRRPDIRKARRELGWRPTTTLARGLRETIRWFVAELAQRKRVSQPRACASSVRGTRVHRKNEPR